MVVAASSFLIHLLFLLLLLLLEAFIDSLPINTKLTRLGH